MKCEGAVLYPRLRFQLERVKSSIFLGMLQTRTEESSGFFILTLRPDDRHSLCFFKPCLIPSCFPAKTREVIVRGEAGRSVCIVVQDLTEGRARMTTVTLEISERSTFHSYEEWTL